ncbi:MAG: hypothetical protein FWF60_04175 [Oscillospiraceae bacterium]|nr:hypothetical protein [Oscillospiraceae bacterium]
MVFDKNQTAFPSPLHEAIWDCGIHILPVEVALPREVADGLPPGLAESCKQLRDFMLRLLGDMYENTDAYLPISDTRRLGIQYRFFRLLMDYALLGEAGEDGLAVNGAVFNRFKQNNGYGSENDEGVTFRDRLKMMERAGLKTENRNSDVVFTNALYPGMFPALRAMAQVPSALKEKASGDNSFMYCDFRKLCPSYKYDKLENALVFLSGEQRQVALALDKIAKKPGLTRSIPNGICGAYGIFYKRKKFPVMLVGCGGAQISLGFRIPYDRANMAPLEGFFWALEKESPELRKYFSRRIHRCRGCKGEGSNACAVPVNICGSPNRLCEHWFAALLWGTEERITMEELPYIDQILDAILACI